MTGIPTITRGHVEAALAQIDREGIPPRREATRYQLVVGTKRYPPKYVTSLAAAHATGRELRPDEFAGGEETNAALRALGFAIEGPDGRVSGAPRAALHAVPRNGASKPEHEPTRAVEPTSAIAARPNAATSAEVPVVRIVVDGQPASSVKAASQILREAFERWPSKGSKFAITPGGFIRGAFPSRWSGGMAWESKSSDLALLVKVATPLVDAAVTPQVLEAAKARTRVITIGVDLVGEAGHAELVAVLDCKTGKIVRWTGKSYPTGSQEMRLVQVTDLSTHLLQFADERVLVLGCHDLNMFSARGRANQSPDGQRRARCDEMNRAVAAFKPTVVVQHPHSTDSANIWRMPWACLARDYPSVRVFASAIGYYAWSGSPRRPLRGVLDGTRSATGVTDIVVKSR